MNSIIIFTIRIYQKFISPVLPPSCRFTPTCSNYAIMSFKKHSFFKALFLSVKRILKCHPFHPGGHDPVP
ncbi:MAG: membrane protein insertion efficiency factor YidD [Candidatus Cloacimonadota bacterium]|nr:MAG: membrane protein insertion efficiency factor YidD [Candidatus Cloacimonadota bacterium]